MEQLIIIRAGRARRRFNEQQQPILKLLQSKPLQKAALAPLLAEDTETAAEAAAAEAAGGGILEGLAAAGGAAAEDAGAAAAAFPIAEGLGMAAPVATGAWQP